MNIHISDNIALSTKSFSGGERHLQLHNLPRKLQGTLNVLAYLTSSDDIMDLLLLQNALNYHYHKEIQLNLELPYLPYARQDRVCAVGQAFSMELFAQLLKNLSIQSLLTWDCHSAVGLRLTAAQNYQMADIIKHSEDLTALLKQHNSVVICPDKGAVNRCQSLVDSLDLKPMVVCEKIRDPATGRITHTRVVADDLSQKTAIITDDICDGGYTFIKIAEQLKQKNAQKVILYVTHAIFSKGLEVFTGLIDEIYTTQSFKHKPNKKVRVIEVPTSVIIN